MKKGTFEGTSANGSIEEALTNAIAVAKKELKTDLVTWKLESISGENGGFVQTNLVTVSMKAKVLKAKAAKDKDDKKKAIKAEVVKPKAAKKNVKAKK